MSSPVELRLSGAMLEVLATKASRMPPNLVPKCMQDVFAAFGGVAKIIANQGNKKTQYHEKELSISGTVADKLSLNLITILLHSPETKDDNDDDKPRAAFPEETRTRKRTRKRKRGSSSLPPPPLEAVDTQGEAVAQQVLPLLKNFVPKVRDANLSLTPQSCVPYRIPPTTTKVKRERIAEPDDAADGSRYPSDHEDPAWWRREPMIIVANNDEGYEDESGEVEIIACRAPDALLMPPPPPRLPRARDGLYAPRAPPSINPFWSVTKEVCAGGGPLEVLLQASLAASA